MNQPRLEMRTRQQMALTPRLQQSVKLLQLSTVDFAQELRTALTMNPFLEEDEPIAADGPPSDGTSEVATDTPMESANDAPSDEIPWDPCGGPSAQSINTPRERYDSEDSDVGDWAAAETTLREHLLQQLGSPHIEAEFRAPAMLIIEALDEDGYLRVDIDELIEISGGSEALHHDTIMTALRLVQNFDPVGIAARSVEECIVLQLKALPHDTEHRALAIDVARHHLHALARRDFASIEHAVGCDDDALRTVHEMIQDCNPRPGSSFGPSRSQIVVPDVIVRKIKGQWVAALNPSARPRIRINRAYARMLRGSKDRAHASLAQHLQEAYWLIRNVEQRFSTIQRVADAIVARQRAFLEVGDVALKPLLMRELAEELGVHESTISRATGSKYMSTPRGTFEFRHFLSREFETDTGGRCSATAVRALLRQMISEEKPESPLTDVELAKMLGNQGGKVARRTIAKYRTIMNLPPAEHRRRL